MHCLAIDEATHFTEVIYRFLRSRVRCAGLVIPDKYKGMFPRIVLASNPGNVGHQWVKAMFIDPIAPHEIWQTSGEEGGLLRQFIPAKLTDNPALERDDPTYRMRLRGMGAELARAMEDGDWNVIAGAFFTEFGPQHVLVPFQIPGHWIKFRAIDWGSRRPFSVGWYAVSDGTHKYRRASDGGEFFIPRGALVRYREWYGCEKPNEGLKLHAPAVAQGIYQRTPKEERISYSVADPSMFAEDGGPSIAETFDKHGVTLIPADHERAPGWEELRARLVGEEYPMLYVFSTCPHWMRTLPVLQHDELKIEDLDTDQEDHAADETRYACMSRPWVKTQEQKRDRKKFTYGDFGGNVNIFERR